MKRHLLLAVFLTTSFLYAQRDSGTPVTGVRVISKTAVSSGTAGKAVQPAYKVGATTGASTGSSQEVGLTEGQLSVSPTGGATYTVPIALPPGVNGVVPSVGLTYNSQSGNGLAGYGWSLSGLSAISRIPASHFHDGQVGTVNFDVFDRFALDGQRLLLKSGSYGSHGAIYQTERYSNLKITSYGSSPYPGVYGPAYFKVAYPDGSVAFYGLNSDSRSPTTYALSYRESPQGIRIHYHYTTSGNTLYIDKIIYGGTDSTPAVNEIAFSYKKRQRLETGYIAGLAFTNDKLLSTIRVKASGKGYRTYLLSHELTSPGYQRLTQITEESGDGSKQYNPTVFAYEDTPKALSDTRLETTLSIQNMNTLNTQVVSSDFTGDGRMDVIIHPSGHTQSNPKDKYWLFTDIQNETVVNIGYRHQIGRFEALFPTTWLNPDEKLMPMQGWVVARHPYEQSDAYRQVQFQVYSTGSTSPIYFQYERHFSWPQSSMLPHQVGVKGLYFGGDFNGDGLTDVLILRHKDVFRAFGGSGGSEWEELSAKSEVVFVNMDSRITTNYATIAGVLKQALKKNTQVRVADVTGDGKANLLIFNKGNVKVYGLTRENTLELLWQTVDTHLSVKHPILLGDYNGDGKTDMIIPKDYGHNYIHYRATGKGFSKTDAYYSVEYKKNKDVPPGLFNRSDYFVQQLVPIDMNHDGKTDLVALESKKYGAEPMRYTVKVYEKHNTFLPGVTRTLNGGKKYPLPLVLRSDRPNDHLEVGMMSDRTIFHFQYLKDMSREKLLRTVTNGYGVQAHIHYSSLTQKELYQEDMPVYQTALYTETYPNTDMGVVPGFYVVSKLERAGLRQLFGYYGGVSNTEGLGFLGFRATAKTNWHNQDIPAMTTLSRQEPSLRGAVTEAYTLAGLPWGLHQTPEDFIRKTKYHYEAELKPNKVFALKNTLRETVNALEGTETRVHTTFDDYHNSTQTTVTVSHNEAGQHSTTTDFTYAHNTEGTPYYVGRMMEKSQRMTGYGDTMTSSETYQYNGQQLPSQIEKTGHQTEVFTETLSYDTFGNITERTLATDGLA
ncbi:MAG: FG-GAP-like repeat-containing protein, partial [Bacteroidota bacterium]